MHICFKLRPRAASGPAAYVKGARVPQCGLYRRRNGKVAFRCVYLRMYVCDEKAAAAVEQLEELRQRREALETNRTATRAERLAAYDAVCEQLRRTGPHSLPPALHQAIKNNAPYEVTDDQRIYWPSEQYEVFENPEYLTIRL